MPYYKIVRSKDSYDEMISELKDEFEKEDVSAERPIRGETAPFIILEEGPHGVKYLTVIWDRFAGISKNERGQIIMDAYEQAFNEERMMKVRLALGLTYEEAEKLGLLTMFD